MSNEELGYEVTPKQSLEGLWKTMHKYIEHHGYSDISLEIESSQYEFRQHLQKYDEYEAKAKAFDEVMDLYVNGSNKYLQTKRHTLDVFIEDVAEILKPFTDKYESGEYDAKK